jgi:cleavage and polyadenylation specificity factor subunit 1
VIPKETILKFDANYAQEEPYKMMTFGRATNKTEVMATEFLPHEKQLYIIVADADKNLDILEYDPESK